MPPKRRKGIALRGKITRAIAGKQSRAYRTLHAERERLLRREKREDKIHQILAPFEKRQRQLEAETRAVELASYGDVSHVESDSLRQKYESLLSQARQLNRSLPRKLRMDIEDFNVILRNSGVGHAVNHIGISLSDHRKAKITPSLSSRIDYKRRELARSHHELQRRLDLSRKVARSRVGRSLRVMAIGKSNRARMNRWRKGK